jgi:TMEM175 potassium channel family protein
LEIIMSDRVDQASSGSNAAQRRATILPLDRFNAFSDGVFAIAITLLVIEIAVPPISAPLLPALQELWPDFLGYFISFSYIGGIWLSHAGLTRLMKQGDSTSYGLNLLMLIFVALLPFTTRLMVTHLAGPDVEIATVIYGLDVLLASLALTLLIFHVARQPHLLVDDLAEDSLRRVYRQRWIAVGVCAFAVVLVFLAPLAAVALYLAVAVLFLVLPLLGMHRARRSAAR